MGLTSHTHGTHLLWVVDFACGVHGGREGAEEVGRDQADDLVVHPLGKYPPLLGNVIDQLD